MAVVGGAEASTPTTRMDRASTYSTQLAGRKLRASSVLQAERYGEVRFIE